MSAATMIGGDPMVISAPETTQPGATILASQIDVEFVICDCCGLTEECTPAYIERIRERYYGKWICGLCAEAVKDEILRSERLVSAEEAMTKHMNFCKKFKTSGPPANPTVHLISAMRQILRRSLDSPRALSRSSSANSGIHHHHGPGFDSSENCFSTLSGSRKKG